MGRKSTETDESHTKEGHHVKFFLAWVLKTWWEWPICSLKRLLQLQGVKSLNGEQGAYARAMQKDSWRGQGEGSKGWSARYALQNK